MGFLKVALDANLNPVIYGTRSMKHLQYANHYRDILKTLKKAGYMSDETIPLKDQYTSCVKSPTNDDESDWSVRVIAGTMTLTTSANGKLKLVQKGVELDDYIAELNINVNSPTYALVRGKLNLMKMLVSHIGTSITTNSKRVKMHTRTKECLGRINNNLKENNHV